MNRIPYNKKELTIIDRLPVDLSINRLLKSAGLPELPGQPVFDRPVSTRENIHLLLHGKTPWWIPTIGYVYSDTRAFSPREIPDNYAQHIIHDGTNDNPSYDSNITRSSWFDLEWEFVPTAGGATVKPGSPKVPDIAEWEKYITMPSLDDIDWDSLEKRNVSYFNSDKSNELHIPTGSWERLMSLLDVENAAVALIDEEQQEGVHRFLNAYTDLICGLINRVKDHCNIDGVLIHDDWGHQRGPFFSVDTAREMLLPYLKRITKTCHDRGLYYEQHSCGKNESFIELYIEAGVDLYCPQTINDFDVILQKTKGSGLVIGMPDIPIPKGLTEIETRELARKWFDKYKDSRVAIAFLVPNPIFSEEIYILSRKYYQ